VTSELGDAAVGTHLDVTDPSSWSAAVELAESRFGQLDILVNNAGIAPFTPIIGADIDAFDRVVAVNQRGGMRRALAPSGAAHDRRLACKSHLLASLPSAERTPSG